MNRFKTRIVLVSLLLAAVTSAAQNRERPLVEMFKENYVTNDLTYQISLRYNCFSLPKDWSLFFGYTQMAIWDVYMPSNPFRSNTYTVGAYLSHDFRDGKSYLLSGYEHRSNGLASYASRSIDCAFASYTRTLAGWLDAQATARMGVGSIGNDFSLEMLDRYEGYVNAAMCIHTRDRRLMFTVSATPLFKGDIPANLMSELAFAPVKKKDWFYLTVRYHYGYDENQNDCAAEDVFLKHMLRFGLSVQPRRMADKLFF